MSERDGKYHALVVKENGKWSVQFGDHSKAVVKEEWRCTKHHYNKGSKHTIVTIAHSEALAELNVAVARFNEEVELV